MKRINDFNIGDKVSRHHRRVRARRGLAAAVKGAARVQGNGRLLVTLPLVDGSFVTYAAHPRTEWLFTEVKSDSKHSSPPTEASPIDRAKAAFEVIGGVIADLGQRIDALAPSIADTAH